MNLVKCSKGHFYDGDRYASCPHCNTQPSDSMTIAMPSGGSNDMVAAVKPGGDNEPVTMARSAGSEPVTVSKKGSEEPVTQKDSGKNADNLSYRKAMDKIQGTSPIPDLDDEGVTVSYYDQKISEPVFQEPVVGWLVCTKGNYFGQSFSLKSGRNFIGRSPQMDVCLEGESSVSRSRHAVVVYEPVGRIFLAQAGEARELFYVNDNVVLDHVQLSPYDVISLGKVNLVFIPCCTKEFAWDDLKKAAE